MATGSSIGCPSPPNGRRTQWRPNLIYFDQRTILRTANYYVQQLFAHNKGDVYIANTLHTTGTLPPLPTRGHLGVDSTLDRSKNELILKLVNPHEQPIPARITLAGAPVFDGIAQLVTLSGGRYEHNSFEHPDTVTPKTSEIEVSPAFDHTIPAMSLQILRAPLSDSEQ